jgi:microcin C transport system permease protein
VADPAVDLTGWQVRLRTPEEQAARWQKWVKGVDLPEQPGYRAVLYQSRRDGLLQGSLGESTKYQDPVWAMIFQRMPVSIYFGLVSMIAVYGICLPLGMAKAIRHRTWFDNASSVAVFAGYAIPGYALGSLLVVFLGAKLGWFPLRGFTGDDFETLSPLGKFQDVVHHTAMPLVCYLIGSFAFMTMLMKNNLMDNLAADYVRTATAKGVSFPRAVFKHAFRNSIIPIATTFGANISLLVAGSMLIERVFDINGFGLLQFNAIYERDEPLIMGVVFFSAVLMLVGNVVSDLCVALVDPRVSYK